MSTHLRCPPIEPEDLAPDSCSRETEQILRDLDTRSDPAPRYFGREVRLAFRRLEALEYQQADEVGSDERTQLLRRLFTRPASEPILYSVWPRFSAELQPAESYAALASMLSGKNVTLSPVRMRTVGGEDDSLVFEDRATSATWLPDIARVRLATGCPVKRALYAYMRTVLAHPLSDGNGRIARALIQFELGACTILSGPKFPVAPSFYPHWEAMTVHMHELSESRSWAKYFEAVLPRLQEAALAAYQDAGSC